MNVPRVGAQPTVQLASFPSFKSVSQLSHAFPPATQALKDVSHPALQKRKREEREGRGGGKIPNVYEYTWSTHVLQHTTHPRQSKHMMFSPTPPPSCSPAGVDHSEAPHDPRPILHRTFVGPPRKGEESCVVPLRHHSLIHVPVRTTANIIVGVGHDTVNNLTLKERKKERKKPVSTHAQDKSTAHSIQHT